MMIQFQCQCADCLFTDYLPTKFSLRKMKRAFSSWQKKLKGRAWNALYIENHDHPRIVSRYGSEQYWKESAKMLAVMYLFQQGTPFVYQGQEIGMINWKPESIDEYRDVQTIWNYHHSALNKTEEQRLQRQWRSARDNARTPVQWSDAPNAGFTTSETPWMNVNPNYTWLNAAQQAEDPDSILNFYKKAIALRKSLKSVRHGTYTDHFPLHPTLWCYSRECKCEKLLVIASYSGKAQNLKVPKGYDLSKGELLLQNYASPLPGILQPYECRVYRFK
jgi:oligo-1,6-glucosidase